MQTARIYEKSNWITRMHHITVFQSHSCHTGSQSENFLCFTTYYMYFALPTILWKNWYPEKCSKNKIRKWAYVVGFGAQQWEEICWYCCTSGQIFGSGKNKWFLKLNVICLQLVCDFFLTYPCSTITSLLSYSLYVNIPSSLLTTSHKSAPFPLYLLLFLSSTVACCPLTGLFYLSCLSSPRSQLLGCADTWVATIMSVLWSDLTSHLFLSHQQYFGGLVSIKNSLQCFVDPYTPVSLYNSFLSIYHKHF